MATFYTVCDGSTTKSVSITMTTGAESTGTPYTDAAGCEVVEKTKRLTFTASAPSTDNYTIWYNYDYEFYQDGTLEYSGTNALGSLNMPAGQTTVFRDVITYKRRNCYGDEDSVGLQDFQEAQ